ncbi:MAG: carbohydrate ABC transporter permease [Lachnospiraceae bacterium]
MIKLKKKRSWLFVLLFILPALLIYTIFQIVPLIQSVYFSVTNWNGIGGSAMDFVGLDNFKQIISNSAFQLALKNMLRMVVFSVLFHTPVALLLAVALNSKCRGSRFFKAMYFVPTVFPLSAVGLMWYFIFMPIGALNTLLETIGLDTLVTPWLVNTDTAMNAIVFVNIWAGIGYYMVILLAGLTSIPEEVYDAAAIDGAGSVRKFFSVTVPMLKNVIFMCILMDIMGSVKVFDLVYAMTGGGPNGLTNLPTTLLYNEAYKYKHYGQGSAIGIVILLICLFGTLVTNLIQNRSKRRDLE